MPRQLWLAAACREWDLDVVEVDGWRTRGSDAFHPRGVICHHTAGAATGDYPSLRVVRDGRPGLAGPLSQIGLGRSGKVYVIAAGRANHAGRGGWRGLAGNYSVLGIEAESVGTRDDWTQAQRAAYPRLVAALCAGLGVSVEMACGHKEWAPTRKIDPAYWSMDRMRREAGRLLNTPPPEDEMPTPRDLFKFIQAEGTGVFLANLESMTAEGISTHEARLGIAEVWGLDPDPEAVHAEVLRQFRLTEAGR